MKIFCITIIDADHKVINHPNYSGPYVSAQGHVVLANSEQDARAYLADMDKDEYDQQPWWLDPLKTECEEIHHTGQGEPRIILSDIPTG